MDFAQLSFTQARKAEVDAQVRVLELEGSLTAERQRLAELRRFNYSHSAEVERVSIFLFMLAFPSLIVLHDLTRLLTSHCIVR